MEDSQHTKTIYAVIAIVVLIFAGWFVLKGRDSIPTESPVPNKQDNAPVNVVVTKTPEIKGVLSAPPGFPQSIPFEKAGIIESAITEFPDQGAKQFTLSYNSTKSVGAKYTEYKTYMQKMNYKITEGDKNAAVRAIYGVKTEANLSVVISAANGKTLVQLSYLVK